MFRDNVKVVNTPEKAVKGYQTYRQWLDQGYIPLPGCDGTLMYTNGYKVRRLLYWAKNEVREGTPEELKAAREQIRQKHNARQRERYRKKKEQERIEQELLRKREEKAFAIRQRDLHLIQAGSLPSLACSNPSKIVVFDLETTGLDPDEDEILQIAMIDGDGNTLLDSYVKPYIHKGWCDAEMIHGISPAMVADKPQIHELIPVIKGIFESADTVVSYNGACFDAAFLLAIGIDISGIPHFDVMHEFAPVYGEWDDYHGNYKWQSLSTCAAYYDYTFKAHNAVEDCKATLCCYKKLTIGKYIGG